MLQTLLIDEETTRPLDPARADHLRDAIADARTLIARLESLTTSDRGAQPPSPTESTRAGHIQDGSSEPPPKWNASAHMSLLTTAI